MSPPSRATDTVMTVPVIKGRARRLFRMDSRSPQPGDAIRLIQELLVQDAMHDLDRPHVVLISDSSWETVTVIGPFPDAMAATVAADAQRAEDIRELGPSPSRSYLVSLLFPPTRQDDRQTVSEDAR